MLWLLMSVMLRMFMTYSRLCLLLAIHVLYDEGMHDVSTVDEAHDHVVAAHVGDDEDVHDGLKLQRSWPEPQKTRNPKPKTPKNTRPPINTPPETTCHLALPEQQASGKAFVEG